jgi:hypothetical protein
MSRGVSNHSVDQPPAKTLTESSRAVTKVPAFDRQQVWRQTHGSLHVLYQNHADDVAHLPSSRHMMKPFEVNFAHCRPCAVHVAHQSPKSPPRNPLLITPCTAPAWCATRQAMRSARGLLVTEKPSPYPPTEYYFYCTCQVCNTAGHAQCTWPIGYEKALPATPC